MRRLLVAGFAALAVLLGLVVTTGMAFAADETPDPNPPAAQVDAGVKADVKVGIGAELRRGDRACAVGTHWNGTACVANPVGDPTCTVDHNPRAPGCQDSGPIYGGPRSGHVGGNWHPGLPWGGPTMYGHQLWLNANLGLDICGFGNSYDMFLNRNTVHRGDIDRYLGRSRWQSLYTSDCGNSSITVLPNGLGLVNGNLLNLQLLGLQGAGTVNVCDYPDYNLFNSHFGSRFGNRWDSVRNRFGTRGFDVYRQLRVNARCTTVVMPSSTTIVQDPNTTYSASPTTDPSSGDAGVSDAPASSTPLPAIAPAKAPSAGGWDTASMLAHARVV